VESVANAAKKAEAIAKKLTEAGSSVRRTDKVLRAQIETILDYGIDRAAWHGVTSLVTTVVANGRSQSYTYV
jgi:hypothetical protein